MDYTIPMSSDERLEKEIGNAKYFLKVPVGRVEREIAKIQQSTFNIKAYIPEAMKKIDSQKGKKWDKGEKTKAILEEAQKIAEDKFLLDFDTIANGEQTDLIFDLVCVGWVDLRSDDKAEKKFKGKPSDHVVDSVKQKIVSWYLDQMHIQEEEAKNS